MEFARDSSPAEPGLGGLLLFAGKIDSNGRALLVAGNIAGAASLVASVDPGTQKQAVRDGVVDFLVTSLDEALRILKNELRKRETVAVCVAADAGAIEREMVERGVLPDLLPMVFAPQSASHFLALGAASLRAPEVPPDAAIVTWTVAELPSKWLPRLDALAFDCLQPSEAAGRRWLRRAPRYMGRLAHQMRVLICNRSSAAAFVKAVRDSGERRELAVAIDIQISCEGAFDDFQFSPAGL
jgi:hypothetical protein